MASTRRERELKAEVARLKAAIIATQKMLRRDPFILVNAANYLEQALEIERYKETHGKQ